MENAINTNITEQRKSGGFSFSRHLFAFSNSFATRQKLNEIPIKANEWRNVAVLMLNQCALSHFIEGFESKLRF